jgi:hypothetical protein
LHPLAYVSLDRFPESTAAKRSGHSVRLNVLTHDRRFVAKVHSPHSVKDLTFGLRHARKLPHMFRPSANEHFGPECSWIFQILVNAEKKNANSAKRSAEPVRLMQGILPGVPDE